MSPSSPARQAWRKGLTEPPLNSVLEVRSHLLGLRAHGVNDAAVSQVTGLPRSLIRKLMSPDCRQVRPGDALAILSVDIEDLDRLPEGLVISARATWRRIDRMMELGWTRTRIARALGFPGREILLGRKHVTVAEARQVRNLYAEQFGIRCDICGKPLRFHSLLEPCLKGGESDRGAGDRGPVWMGRLVPLG